MAGLLEIARRSMTPDRRLKTFLQVPPFPGARIDAFVRLPTVIEPSSSLADCIALTSDKRIGGTFWAAQPLVPRRYLLVRPAIGSVFDRALIEEYGEPVFWCRAGAQHRPRTAIVCECDPWHMLSGATALVCAPDDDVRVVAAILSIPTYLADRDGNPLQRADDAQSLIADALPVTASFVNPFGPHPLTLVEVIQLCGFWRTLIDANRNISVGLGFAFWKQDSVLPLLWGGGDSSGFFRDVASAKASEGEVALWRSKVAPDLIERLERRGTPIVEVEDGFLRSAGLGADCIPPLSITVDPLGAYFDPAQPSELEQLLEHGSFDPTVIERAGAIRDEIVAAGLGKYGRSDAVIERFDPNRRHILVAGQVEDDRSVMTGGFGLVTNLALLERVRANRPDAYLIYKPHPDVVAGHRKGVVSEEMGRQLADKVVTDHSITSLIDMVDEVHVNTSLAGFEALMRQKNVITYGVPFYAGWGLTCDLGPVPARRTRRLTLDQLVAATLLLYPRYLDPQSGLPCPAEIVVDRLTRPTADKVGALVHLRRLQGRMRARFASWFSTMRR